MSTVTSEDLIRVEHKLDVIIKYLYGMTGIRPDPLPRMADGGNGITDGVCPVTSSPIAFRVDPLDGRFHRVDALLASLPRMASGIAAPPEWALRKTHNEGEQA